MRSLGCLFLPPHFEHFLVVFAQYKRIVFLYFCIRHHRLLWHRSIGSPLPLHSAVEHTLLYLRICDFLGGVVSKWAFGGELQELRWLDLADFRIFPLSKVEQGHSNCLFGVQFAGGRGLVRIFGCFFRLFHLALGEGNVLWVSCLGSQLSLPFLVGLPVLRFDQPLLLLLFLLSLFLF